MRKNIRRPLELTLDIKSEVSDEAEEIKEGRSDDEYITDSEILTDNHYANDPNYIDDEIGWSASEDESQGEKESKDGANEEEDDEDLEEEISEDGQMRNKIEPRIRNKMAKLVIHLISTGSKNPVKFLLAKPTKYLDIFLNLFAFALQYGMSQLRQDVMNCLQRLEIWNSVIGYPRETIYLDLKILGRAYDVLPEHPTFLRYLINEIALNVAACTSLYTMQENLRSLPHDPEGAWDQCMKDEATDSTFFASFFRAYLGEAENLA
ncbi:hypothetical protein BS50DRAFT_631048 [Corynespora cassiicola Philippines]|uniref:Uncharacterized protein n=1 Tax=Corynespora cassiicola Philippines TaxID=1448308 RepID=A0A2T2P006_CORCC|nr:hypothetical protein BS50DRAFT_631048 [Corynespora cassiicola Philippines]